MSSQKHVLWDRLNPEAWLLRDWRNQGSEGSLGDSSEANLYYDSKEKFCLLTPSILATFYFKYQHPPLPSQGDTSNAPIQAMKQQRAGSKFKDSPSHTRTKMMCLEFTKQDIHSTNPRTLTNCEVVQQTCCWQSQQLRRKRFSSFCQLWNWAPSKYLMIPRLSWTSLSL